MNEDFYIQTSRIEDRHWWFRHRRRLVAELLRGEWDGRDRPRWLDVGCGSGGNLRTFTKDCSLAVGLDRSPVALQLAARKLRDQVPLVLGDANRLGDTFRPGSFDLITLFNVLYHREVPDEQALLRQAHGLMREGGLLLLTEPALRFLFRRHDLVDHGARRYRLGRLCDLVHSVGLTVERASYFNAPALPFVLARAMLDRVGGRMQESGGGTREMNPPGPLLNRLIFGLLGLERFWIRHLGRLPAGVSALVLARRAGAADR